MNGVMDIAQSPILWGAVAVCICMVLWQAYVFFRKSWKAGVEIGMDTKVMKEGIKAAAITSIGPSIAVGVGVLALLTLIGGPMAWYRLSYVGSLSYEGLAANLSMNALGLQVGEDVINGTAFATICWVMTIGAFGFTIVATVLSPKVTKMQDKLIGNNMELLGVISAAALMSSMGAQATQYMLSFTPNFASVIGGAVAMTVFVLIANKKKLLWLKELSLFFALVVGMLCAVGVA